MQPMLAQIPFCIKGCHATAAGGAYGLPVYLVLHIAAGKDAGNIGAGRAGLRDEVTLVVHIEQAFEEA